MKPLICPQCGGSITNYSTRENFATCSYCTTKFLIETEKPKPVFQPAPVFESLKVSSGNPNLFVGVLVGVFFVFIALIAIGLSFNKRNPTIQQTYNSPRYSPTTVPTLKPTPNPNLLEFGGKGTGNGMFQDADAIAVDSKGRIYVADDSLRVQQFNEKGEFLKLWQIPSQTKFYKRARSIQKIAVDKDDRLYVLVGGTILLYENNETEPYHTFEAAPDFMVDFAFRNDGGLLIVYTNWEIETLIFVNRTGKVTRRIQGFHTEAADAVLSPRETGLAAIRLAVDGAGGVYSVYAFKDLGSYQLNYDAEDMLIFRFTPEGKYVNKFVHTTESCGIEVDNQSRIYISEQNSINAYSNNGEIISTVSGLEGINAFALDKQNNIYVLMNDKVIKRPAI